MPPALAIGGAALLGGVAGALPKKSEQTSMSTVDAGDPTARETQGGRYLDQAASGYAGMVNAGPGQSDVAASTGAQRDLAAMLKQYSQGGYAPTAADISSSNSLAAQLFQAQRTGLGQSFEDQTTAANRQAALLGRSVNDPILQAKLRTEQMRQSSMLDANQGAWASQYALSQPMQRLDFATQHAGVLGGLATQAMQNRQQLAAMGEALMNNERNFRLATASRSNTQNTSSGGGIGGFITGALGGVGAGMSAATGFQNLGLFGQNSGTFTPYTPSYQLGQTTAATGGRGSSTMTPGGF